MMRCVAYFFILLLIPIACFAASPNRFFGTYKTGMDCRISFLIIDKEHVTIDECKKLPYKIVDRAEDQITIDVTPSQACPRKIIEIERKELQYKAEGKGPRSDVPTYTSLNVSIYDNYENLSIDKPIETRSYRQVNPSTAGDQTVLFLNGKTSQQRKQALHEMNLQCYAERDKYNEIGLKDPSPDVRGIAASFLRGEPNNFVPILIKVMADDPDEEVRARAGYSLTHFYTDNGSDGDLYIKPLEDNLDKLLIGLKRVQTVRSVTAILGSRYTGGSFAPCLMSAKNREKVFKALRSQLKTIQLKADAWSRGKASWNNQLNEANHEINRAIENLPKCNLTN